MSCSLMLDPCAMETFLVAGWKTLCQLLAEEQRLRIDLSGLMKELIKTSPSLW